MCVQPENFFADFNTVQNYSNRILDLIELSSKVAGLFCDLFTGPTMHMILQVVIIRYIYLDSLISRLGT